MNTEFSIYFNILPEDIKNYIYKKYFDKYIINEIDINRKKIFKGKYDIQVRLYDGSLHYFKNLIDAFTYSENNLDNIMKISFIDPDSGISYRLILNQQDQSNILWENDPIDKYIRMLTEENYIFITEIKSRNEWIDSFNI